MYFQLLEESKLQRNRLERKHEQQVDSLQREIDDLGREIDRLKGIPVSYRGYYPEPVEEYPVEEVIYFVESDAIPVEELERFKSNIVSTLSNMTTKSSGNITIELTILKDGKVHSKVLHAAQDKSDVVMRLSNHLDQQSRKPATSSGRVMQTSTIVSINIGPSK
jgi:hypothetical protein